MPKSLNDRNETLKLYTGQSNTIGTAITPYIMLYTVAPTAAGGGTECPDSNYARQSAAGKFAAPTTGTVTSNADVVFPALAAQRTIVAAGLIDASSGGTLRHFQVFGSPIVVPAGAQPRFRAGFINGAEA